MGNNREVSVEGAKSEQSFRLKAAETVSLIWGLLRFEKKKVKGGGGGGGGKKDTRHNKQRKRGKRKNRHSFPRTQTIQGTTRDNV